MDEREHSDDDANDAGPNRQNQDRQHAVDRQQNQQGGRNAGHAGDPDHARSDGARTQGSDTMNQGDSERH